MALKWSMDQTYSFDITESTIFEFSSRYNRFISSGASKDYDKVVILNLHSVDSLAPGTVNLSKKASEGTCSTFLAKKALSRQLSARIKQEQDALLNLICDFYNESGIQGNAWKLHAIFASMDHSPTAFANEFVSGFTSIPEKYKKIISDYKTLIGKTFQTMSLYSTKSGMYIGMVENLEIHSMLFDILFKIHKPKIFFLVNLDTKDICIRKSTDLVFDLSHFCGKILDGYAFRNNAGGKITEKFVTFSKDFKPCQEYKTK